MTLLKPMIETLVAHHLKVTIYRLDGVLEPQATRHNVSAVITLLLFFTQQTIQRARRQGGSAPLLFEMPVKLGHANERYPRDIEIDLPAVPQPVHETDMPREEISRFFTRFDGLCDGEMALTIGEGYCPGGLVITRRQLKSEYQRQRGLPAR